MRPAALSIAVLLGIATLGGASEARATPTLSATIVIESERTVLVGGKRHHHGFYRGPAPHRHKGFARHHKRWHDGRHHRPAFVAKRFHKAPVVIIQPAYGFGYRQGPARSFGYRYLPARPLIKNGRFARGPNRW
jgi:hypothetical protein